MRALWKRKGYGPIGVDFGSRSIKLVQLTADRARLFEAARWDLALESSGANPTAERIEALKKVREGRKFRGRSAVLCLGCPDLFVQNIRVPKGAPGDLEALVRQEAQSRLPFPPAEAELRFLEAGEVRQGDVVRREIIVVACHRPVLEQLLHVVEAAGLKPVGIDIEPLALLRAYASQFRRDSDQSQRAMFVHVGQTNTAAIIAQGSDVLFIKYVDLGGKHFDEAVARNLKMGLAEAWALRRNNGDRRAEQQDPEIARSISESVRPVVERLAGELALCLRYYSVTFRGQPLKRLVLGGGEATPGLLELIGTRLDLKSELGDPVRPFEGASVPGRRPQWDVAMGLALRPTVRERKLAPEAVS